MPYYMNKNYKQPKEDNEANKVNEPIAAYRTDTEMIPSPPLTEEELANAMTGDEFLDTVLAHIDKLFDNK